MAGLPEELAALQAQVAALTARVNQLERLLNDAPVVDQDSISPSVLLNVNPKTFSPSPAATNPPAAPPPPPLSLSPSSSQPRRSLSRGKEGDLEKKIGQYWLNRIGIAAMLIGVSYFLKYAFENNWIGPAGRIAIGLIAGIALILWNERFRADGHVAFS